MCVCMISSGLSWICVKSLASLLERIRISKVENKCIRTVKTRYTVADCLVLHWCVHDLYGLAELCVLCRTAIYSTQESTPQEAVCGLSAHNTKTSMLYTTQHVSHTEGQNKGTLGLRSWSMNAQWCVCVCVRVCVCATRDVWFSLLLMSRNFFYTIYQNQKLRRNKKGRQLRRKRSKVSDVNGDTAQPSNCTQLFLLLTPILNRQKGTISFSFKEPPVTHPKKCQWSYFR